MIDWRFLTINDIGWINRVGKQMFAESEWKEGEYDDEKINRYLHHVASHPLYMCGLIGLKDDERAGFLIGQIGEYRFMNKLVARENELCVLPEYRGSMVAITLMKRFIDWAKTMKADEILFEPSVILDQPEFIKVLLDVKAKLEVNIHISYSDVTPNPERVPALFNVQPEGIETVSPDAPRVMVPDPLLVSIFDTFNVPFAIMLL